MALLRPFRLSAVLLTAIALLAGCAAETNSSDSPPGSSGEQVDPGDSPPLTDLDTLVGGAPSNDELPGEGKADARYPETFDLADTQSPVRSQGRRGVCSIFSTVGLMEHLYIKEGTITDPNFSEQFLQWSVKTELGEFPNSGGSNARYNLEAIHEHGIVEEMLWPYEPNGWNESDDPDCTGEDQPTRCYTNGEPPDMALEGERFHLPEGRWINSRPRSVKGHMHAKETGVVVGLDFFYQAWSHGGSELPTRAALKREGVVPYPNEADKEDSRMRPAGHSILLMGWDDEREVQAIDENGEPAVDDAGEPIMEKGFFLFKNSWGTGSFGTENPFGPGYGWISYDYVEEYGRAYVSDEPRPALEDEICNDGEDNDLDGAIDCEDADCADSPACTDPQMTYTSDTEVPIPDDDPAGVTSTIEVPDGGTIASLSVDVQIRHTYRGDLTVALAKQGGDEVVLLDRAGGGDDDVRRTFAVNAFNGEDTAGTWELVVADHAAHDTGALESWELTFTRCDDGDCAPTAERYENDTQMPIPDNDPAGVTSEIDVPDGGEIATVSVDVDILHTYRGDLTIRLRHPGGTEVTLLEADASSGEDLHRTFRVRDLMGRESRGTWALTVADEAARDEGTLEEWSLEITR
ncbi:MAG: proprotein convertase P-domain-containing protein [Polyangiales bacterium]